MEAPKIHFNNMDAQVDPVRHDHPGLQAPVYRDNHNVGLDEDDLEDSVDGQIVHDYQDDKVHKKVSACYIFFYISFYDNYT